MKRFTWYYHRLRAMPPAEIVYRARQKVDVWLLSLFGPPRKLFQIRQPLESAFSFRIKAPSPRLVEEAAEEFARIAQLAKGQKRNAFALLGLPERDFGTPINWFTDPVTGKTWPATENAFSIDFRHQENLGEVKYVWELGRMPWLVPRAIAARLLTDREVARTVIEDIISFVKANPPYHGVHWTSGLEQAVRIVNWTWALALIEPLRVFTDAELQCVAQYVAVAADFCHRFRSLYSSSNNHLIGEAVGMEIAGRCWRFSRTAHKFGDLGGRMMDGEFPRQVTPDGACVELSVAYLLEDLEWSFCAAAVRRHANVGLPSTWLQRWGASAHFLEMIQNEGCPFPALGDSDDARILPLGLEIKASHWPQILRCFCGNSANYHYAEQPLAVRLARWIWSIDTGDQVASKVAMMSPPKDSVPQETSSSHAELFQPSGILVLKGKETKLVADFGPHGYGPLYAHAHADALSITIDGAGEQILIDPGTYCYHGQRVWRNWFRSTRAHNTLEVDERDQSEMRGPFLWGRVAKTRLECWTLGGRAECAASHDGYTPWRHRRTISTDFEDKYVVWDEVFAEMPLAIRPNKITLWWHFAPGELSVKDGHATWQGKLFECLLEWEPCGEAITYLGEQAPLQGWMSPKFSVRVAAPALGVHFQRPAMPFFCRTVIAIRRCAPDRKASGVTLFDPSELGRQDK